MPHILDQAKATNCTAVLQQQQKTPHFHGHGHTATIQRCRANVQMTNNKNIYSFYCSNSPVTLKMADDHQNWHECIKLDTGYG